MPVSIPTKNDEVLTLSILVPFKDNFLLSMEVEVLGTQNPVMLVCDLG